MELQEFVESLKLSTVFPTWEETRKAAFERDKTCQMLDCLTFEEIQEVKKNPSFHIQKGILDACHILDRSTHKEFYCYLDNIIVMSRYFHNLLTEHRHPITRKHLNSREEVLQWYFRAKFQKLIEFSKISDYYIKVQYKGRDIGIITKEEDIYFASDSEGNLLGKTSSLTELENFYKQNYRSLI